MRFRNAFRRSMVLSGCLMLAAFWLAGCEDGGSDGDDLSVAADETAETATEEVPAEPEDPNFPDGLHPSGSASEKIAQIFARQIEPLADAGGNQTNVVVCIGDSITSRGYPPYLADETGMIVVNEGKGGEGSGGTASRVAGVLTTYRPAYLCILTGINDISGGDAPMETVVANVERICDAARANNTIPIVGTLTPLSGSRKEWAADGQACSAAIRAMASRTGTRLADIAAAF